MKRVLVCLLMVACFVIGDTIFEECYDLQPSALIGDTVPCGVGMGNDASFNMYSRRVDRCNWDVWGILRQFQAGTVMVLCTIPIASEPIMKTGPDYTLPNIDSLLNNGGP